MFEFNEIIGFVAATCTTIAFVPQVVKTYRSKSAKDVSLGMFSLFTTGVLLWLIYGILTYDKPIIIANIVTLVLVIMMIFFKFKYKNQ
ncbi:SemiSWEET transporter [Fulvivirgaceae bacterium BMA10]|uniref:SemiSWEET transporter n=1 Tax=Splendidivirga corallicola TaxID=3051826 RepID=A0ABT8KNK6_9BACT|nr:SemiSWEET transporter [Fulvivirgaceae bacterium BMA10]